MTANRTSTPSGGLADPATYRGDDGGHTERLLEHQDPPLLRGGADDVSVDAAGFLRKPLQEQGGVQDFSLCLLQRLSLNSIGKGHCDHLPVSDTVKAASRVEKTPVTKPTGCGEISSDMVTGVSSDQWSAAFSVR